jgi:hypothetical protein
MKVCRGCGVEKDLDEFHKSEKGMLGRKSRCKECLTRYARSRYKPVSSELSRTRNLKNKYNISLEEYNALFDEQKGCCAICGRHQTEFKRSLVVDHSHITGEIRGLLCNGCNTALGLVHEDVNRLKSAINYLKNRASQKKPPKK